MLYFSLRIRRLNICPVVLLPALKPASSQVWHNCKFPFFGRVTTRDSVHSVDHSHVLTNLFHYINTLKQELNGTKAYEKASIDEKSVIYSHSTEVPNKFAVDVKERQDRLPTIYWLPKLHKRPIKLGSLQILALVQLQNIQNY